VFDLASVSKLFTCIAVLQLSERKKIALSSTIGSIDKRFLHISDVTVEELLSFRTALQTTSRIDTAENAEQAQKLLFDIHPGPAPKKKFYTDMGAMVLKYVVESASGLSYWEYCGRTSSSRSVWNIPMRTYRRNSCRTPFAITTRRTVALGGTAWISTARGNHSRPKARLLRTLEPGPFGHAGLFSTLRI
jgi:hypothetical protein